MRPACKLKQRYPGMKLQFHGDAKTFKDEELKEALNAAQR